MISNVRRVSGTPRRTRMARRHNRVNWWTSSGRQGCAADLAEDRRGHLAHTKLNCSRRRAERRRQSLGDATAG